MNQEITNDSLNNRLSLSDGSGSQDASRSKFQPVRIKTLLAMYESEDEDSEDKGRDSEEEDDEDECQPLPADNLELDESQQAKNSRQDKLQAENSEIVTKYLNTEKVAEEPETLTLSKTSSSMIPSESSIPSTSMNSNWQSYPRDKRRSSVSKEPPNNTDDDQQVPHPFKSIKRFTSHFGKLDVNEGKCAADGNFPQQKSSLDQEIVKPEVSSAVIFESSQRRSNIKLEAPDVVHTSHEKHIHGVVTYKVENLSNVKNDPPASSHVDAKSSSLDSNQIALETPIKHQPIVGSMRPVPSVSHRSMFQTPRNKTQVDYPPQTPATIFSSWQPYSMINTPMQRGGDEVVQTPSGSVLPKHDANRHKNKEGRGVRRPLTETTPSEHRTINENSHHPAPLGDHVDPSDNQNRRVLEPIHDDPPKKSLLIQESKENHRPPMSNTETSVKTEICQDNKPNSKVPVVPAVQSNLPRVNYPNHPQPNAQTTPTVQASVPSTTRKTQYGNKITVKGKNYLILGNLGQGMSGEVFRVQDLITHELRAIKCVDLSNMERESAQSCIHEISMLVKLQAPCVVKLYDYELKGKIIYTVMEMGDTDLSRFLKSISAEKRLPLTMILYYWTEMLTAVKHIHDNGVIHSDLKPANFLLVRGRLKLIDFGISSSLNAEMTSIVKSASVGTLNYMSPEAVMDVGGNGDAATQNLKYKISYKSDVWSLGCILYSLVFGYTPFQHVRKQWAKISAITNPNPQISFTPPESVEPIPSILIDVLRSCLQHDPKARPSVEQLLQVNYVSAGKNISPVPHIPSNILLKIKSALDDKEWREFTNIMGQRKHH